jgi:hypothetical protein
VYIENVLVFIIFVFILGGPYFQFALGQQNARTGPDAGRKGIAGGRKLPWITLREKYGAAKEREDKILIFFYSGSS